MAPTDIVGSCSTDSVPKATITLEPSLLRAVNVHTVLRGCCSTFRSQEPLDSNYQQSFETTHISDFLSHDWASSRWSKLLGLCLVYNSRSALVASMLVACVLAALQYGPDPVLPSPKPVVTFTTLYTSGGFFTRISQASKYAYWSQFCCPLVFVIFFFFWQDFRALARLGTRSCFLDKFCIDQTNAERKAAGIFGLAGFLRCSDRFVVLWTPKYFTRLWCTYEVASWLHLRKPMSSVLLMPLAHAQILLTLTSGWCCGTLVITMSFFIFPELFIVFMVLGCLVALTFGAHQARRSIRHLRVLTEQLASFSVTSSDCYCCTVSHRKSSGVEVPCDRQVVYDTISEWFGGGERSKLSGKLSGGEEAALARFDRAVQKRFAPQVLAKAGPTKLPYRYAILVGWCFIFRGFDTLSSANQIESYNWNSMLVYPAMVFGVVPVWYKLAMHLAWVVEHWIAVPNCPLADYLLSLLLGALYSLLVMLLWVPLELLASTSTHFWPTLIAVLALAVATALLYAEDLPELSDLLNFRSGAKKHAPFAGEVEVEDQEVDPEKRIQSEADELEQNPSEADGADPVVDMDSIWSI